jgi:CxxC motif-containing protein (DUF1111 family)
MMSIPNSRIRDFACVAAFALGSGVMFAQTDPGPRGGPAGAGGKYPTLNPNETFFFSQAQTRFKEVDSVLGTIPGEAGLGLGPTFNGNSCAMCHAQPAVGGSSPGLISKQNPIPNPQVALAALDGASNTVPPFIQPQGPVMEARFVNGPNGPDGGVHGLFTIQGRHDATGCTLAQPDFQTALNTRNVVFRIPTPVFGLGLVENTPDATLLANLAATASARAALGIGGSFNTSGNDGSITKFGWKAQNKSLVIFSGEAYNVEQGVSNDVFPNERSAVAGCVFNATPEDSTILQGLQTRPSVGTAPTASNLSSDVINFAAFARLLAPPTPTTNSPSETNGQALFASVGCALCHSTSLTSAKSIYTGMSNETYHPYSDFALHHMGQGLADGVTQGAAVGDQWRTAPLWGLGQRLFFIHDGRTPDLMQAIQFHQSPGSEATQVIQQFNTLSPQAKQDLLNFLRSL